MRSRLVNRSAARRFTTLSGQRAPHDKQPSLIDVIREDRSHGDRPFIHTTAKGFLLNLIEGKVSQLTAGQFAGVCGSTSTLAHGEKGIGKTQALCDAVRTIDRVFPTIVPIYAEYLGTSRVSSSYTTPSQQLAKALNKRGLQTDPTLESCLSVLEANDLHALVVSDEVDALYTADDDKGTRLDILHELAMLGSSSRGRTYSLICGSASTLPLLITKDLLHYPDIAVEYALLPSAPNLNGTKYPQCRVSQGVLTKQDFHNILEGLRFDQSHANALFFIAGSNIRTVERVLLAKRSPHNSEDMMAEVLQSLNPSLWGTRADYTRENFGDLLAGCYSRLVKKNEELLHYLERAGGSQPEFWERLNSIDWLERLQPLESRDLHDLIENCNTSRTQSKRLSAAHVGALIDKGWLSGPCDPEVVYPCSGLFLYHQYLAMSVSGEPSTTRKILTATSEQFDRVLPLLIRGLQQ